MEYYVEHCNDDVQYSRQLLQRCTFSGTIKREYEHVEAREHAGDSAAQR